MGSKIFRSDFLDLSISVDENPDPKDFWLHIHSQYELYCFISGDAEFIIEGQRYSLCPGDIMIMRPGELHKLIIRSGVPYERCVFQFSAQACDGFPGLLKPFHDRVLGKWNRFDAERLHGAVASEIFASLKDIDFGSENAETEIRGRFVAVLSYMLQAFSAEPDSMHAATELDEIIAYIDAHLSEELGVDRLAAVFSGSRSQLNNFFKENTGLSTHQYVTAKRLYTARNMLAHGEKPSAVSEKCGFKGYSVFYRAYRKFFGKTPQNDDFSGDGLIDSGA